MTWDSIYQLNRVLVLLLPIDLHGGNWAPRCSHLGRMWCSSGSKETPHTPNGLAEMPTLDTAMSSTSTGKESNWSCWVKMALLKHLDQRLASDRTWKLRTGDARAASIIIIIIIIINIIIIIIIIITILVIVMVVVIVITITIAIAIDPSSSPSSSLSWTDCNRLQLSLYLSLRSGLFSVFPCIPHFAR